MTLSCPSESLEEQLTKMFQVIKREFLDCSGNRLTEFRGISGKLLQEGPPERVIQLSLQADIEFILFFWSDIIVGSSDNKFYWNPRNISCIKSLLEVWDNALSSLIFYVKENLLILRESDCDNFVIPVLCLYHSKIRKNFKHVIKCQKSNDAIKFLDKIDLEFYRLSKNLASGFPDYQIPIDIHSSLLHEFINVTTFCDRFECKAKFFVIMRYFLRTTSTYDLLIWLADQRPNFIKFFLALNNYAAINADVIRKIYLQKFRSLYFKGLFRIVPVFQVYPKKNIFTLTLTEDQIHINHPSLNALTLSQIGLLIGKIILKLK